MRKSIYGVTTLLSLVFTMTASGQSLKTFPVLSGVNKGGVPSKVQKATNLNEDKGIPMYGATLNNAAQYVSFTSKDVYNLNYLGVVDPEDDGLHLKKLRCGANCGGEYLGYIVKQYTLVEQPAAFVKVNFNTGEATTIQELDPEDETWPTLYEMTWDWSNSECIALGRGTKDYATSDIYTINTENGEYDKVAELDFYAWALACDYDGRVYVIEAKTEGEEMLIKGAYLTELNPNDGYKVLSRVELKDNNTAILPYYTHTMEFDNNSNKLYWFCMTNENNKYEYEIDTKKGTCTNIGNFVFNTVVGLNIPFKGADSRDAAGKVTGLTATTPEGSTLQASLSWTNPTVTWRGDNLTELKSVTVSRGTEDNVVATLDATGKMGEQMTWTDEAPTAGVNTYYLTPYRKTGEKGLVDSVKVYAGQDVPTHVDNLVATKDNNNIRLSWSAPTTSRYGKTFDESTLAYDITRLPDNKVVATDVKTTTWTDTKLGYYDQYAYQVTTKNQYGTGETATSNGVYGGNPYEVNFVEDFETKTQADRWQIIDANEDGLYFTYIPEVSGAFKDYRLSMSSRQESDDYLVSPPISVSGGKTYKVTAVVELGHQKDMHNFAFAAGTKLEASSLQTLEEYKNLKATKTDDAVTYSTLYTPESSADTYFAIHCTSPSSSNYSYFGVKAFKVEEVFDTDLAATAISTNKELAVNAASTAQVSVTNAGKNTVSGYTVQVVDESNNVLGEATVNSSLASQKQTEVSVSFTPKTAGEHTLYGRVVLDGDENDTNDLSEGFNVKVNQEGGLSWNVTCKGEDAGSTYMQPFDFTEDYSTTETVYTNDELGKKDGTIKAMAFEYTPDASLTEETEPFEVEVYLGNTDKDGMYEEHYDDEKDYEAKLAEWTNNSELTLVYKGTATIKPGTETQLLSFAFDTPFKYDSSKNLLVQVWKTGATENMFPAGFNTYDSQAYDMIQWSGSKVFAFETKQWTWAQYGKPVAYFSVDYSTGIKNLKTNGGQYVQVEVFDLQGRSFGKASSVDALHSLNVKKGVYVLRLTDAQGNTTSQKVVLGK